MRTFLSTNPLAKQIELACFPPYCPELNPDEQVWNRIKTQDLRNTCYQNIKELKDKVVDNLNNLAQRPHVIAQFFKHPETAFYA